MLLVFHEKLQAGSKSGEGSGKKKKKKKAPLSEMWNENKLKTLKQKALLRGSFTGGQAWLC